MAVSPLTVLLFSALFICSVMSAAAVSCPDVCTGSAPQYKCATSTIDFLTVGTSNWVWFNAVFNTGLSGKGFSFTNQAIYINGALVANPPDSYVNVGTNASSTTATTTYSGNRWTTNAQPNCGKTFLSGLGYKPTASLGTTSNWTWCGLFQSQDNITVTWSFGAAAYNTDLSNMNNLGVKPADNCPNLVDFAGTPANVKENYIQGGTILPESTNYVGRRDTPESFQNCYCPVTLAPTAPTEAPTKAPTRAPTEAPTKAPTRAPTEAPTRAPTNAPTPPTDAPTRAPTEAPTKAPSRAPTEAPTGAPTNAPTAPTKAPTRAPTEAPTNAPTKAPTAPTDAPTRAPTRAPTEAPTKAPTRAPTEAPTRAPTEAPTKAPTRAPTAPTVAPTRAPTRAPTPAPSRAPTEAPTRAPTNAPTPPTDAPTRAPTEAPTRAPTKAPTEAPTGAPTGAPTAPTDAPTRAPTRAPTEAPTRAPTEAPTRAPTRAPTEAPTKAPTRAPTEAPTGAPTIPTDAPTESPTRAPTEAPTRAPTRAPTEAPTRAPTEAPTNAPTPPTVRPTRAPTAPTPVPLTNSPTTAAPTAPIDICTRQFTAHFTLTYPSMQYGYVGGLLVYDWTKNVIAFYYTNQQYQEIYTFNPDGSTTGQGVIRISPNGTCAPCARYQNNWAFPVFWNVSGVANPYPTGPRDANGCQNYTVPASNNNWAQYYGLYPNGTLCYIGNQGRLFTLDSVEYCGKYSPNVTTPPFGCACNTPQDIVFALDRSTSILTSSTHIYREFISQFVNAYTFDENSPTTSTQMAIVQYGNTLNPITRDFPVGERGSITFTMNGANIKNTVTQIGCVGNPCNFCNGNDNETFCVYPDTFKTCTSCGIYGAGALFKSASYTPRQSSTKIIIVITDGNANIQNASNQPNGVPELCCGDGDPITQALVPGLDPNCDDGLYQNYYPYGCFYDIIQTRKQVEAMVPGVIVFAVGIGEYVNTDTLKVIASNDNAVFASPSWSEFLTSINSLLTITCVEPDPITSCGTGTDACGFCACGNTQLPDGIIPPNLCESIVVVPNGKCNQPVPVQLNCTTLPCKDTVCIPSLNNGTGGCTYKDTICNTVDECYEPKCIQGRCVPKAQCANSTNPACLIPCPPAPECPVDPMCANYTGGLGCGCNATCNHLTGRCNCTDGYHGAFCQFPPGVPECTTTDECDDTSSCTTEFCNNSTKECHYDDIDCDDENACTLDFCNATGCQNIQNVVCNDNNGCTADFCNATTAQCYYGDLLPDCDYLEDICNIPYCDPTAPVDNHCFRQPVVCPRDNNCSIAICVVNDTSSDNITGCTNQTVDCVIIYIGIAAGIAAGVIAAIVAAGVILCFAVVSGSAYAVSQSNTLHTDQAVNQNPLYRTGVKTGAGLGK